MKSLVAFCAAAAVLQASSTSAAPQLGYAPYTRGYHFAEYATPLVDAVVPHPYYPGAVTRAAVPAHGLLAPARTQYHAQDMLGQARYGHDEPLQSHHAVQDAFGNKMGHYSHATADGHIMTTSYVADALGYRATTVS